MARIQFDDFDDVVFSTEMVCPPPLNPGGHTDNVQMLQLVSIARSRFQAWLGYPEGHAQGVALFVGDQAVQYKAEAFAQQPVLVQLGVRDLAAKGFDVCYRVVDADTGAIIVLGKIGMVCVDRISKRPCAVPEVLRQRLGAVPRQVPADLCTT